jgi:hypothetical protein
MPHWFDPFDSSLLPFLGAIGGLFYAVWQFKKSEARQREHSEKAEALQREHFEKAEVLQREHFEKAEARQREQFEKADARTAEAQEIQREIAEKADQRAAEAHRVQREIAAETQKLQRDLAEKPLLVEKHKEAASRCRLILGFKVSTQTGEGWKEFMESMNAWLAENRLYLSVGAYDAFKDALKQRLILDTIGDGPEVMHHRLEAFKKLDDDCGLIVEHSPRY